MPDSEKVYPGDPIRYDPHQHNRAVDAVRAVLRHEHDLSAQPGRYGRKCSGTIPVLNSTGKALDPFSIVALTVPIVGPDVSDDEFKREPALTGVVPTATNRDVFAILQNGAVVDQIVDGMLVGVSLVTIQIDNEDDEFAKAEAGNTDSLVGGSSGPARIVWKESGAGVKWAVVRLGATPTYVYAAKMQTELTADTPAQGDLYTDKDGRDLGYEVEVTGKMLGSQTLAAEKWGYVLENEDGEWLLIAAECPD